MDTVPARRPFLRDAVVATVTLAALYGLLETNVTALALPGYLLVVGFDLLEVAFGSAGGAYPVLFSAYLVGLGLLAAAAAGLARERAPDVANWRLGVGGALAVVGTLSLLFGLAVLVGTSQLAPVLITGTAGLAMLVAAGWVLGERPGWLFEIASRP